jgi:iron complex outermembrane receptor protein
MLTNWNLKGRGNSGISNTRIRMRYYAGASAVCLAALLTGTDALAQSAADSAPVQEVVVTARKKAENLQDVPLSITAVTAQQLAATGTVDLQGITELSPGVTYTSFGAGANAQIIIRGISDTSGGYSTSANVSTFLDGIYIKNPGAIDLSLGGVDRVEIVKGPVSTTYGRNAFMGAVNYVTSTPGNTVHGDAAYTVGDHGRNVGYADVSGPIIDGILKGSIAGTYDTYDGYDQDKVTGTYTNGHDKKDMLATLVFTPISKLAITGVFYHGDDTFTQPTDVSYKSNCGGPQGIYLGTFTPFDFYCGSLNKNQIGPYGASVPYETGLTRRVNHLHVDAKYTDDWGTIDVLAGGNVATTETIDEFDDSRYGLPFATYNLTMPQAGYPPYAAGPNVLAESEFGVSTSERDASVEARYDSPQQYRLRFSFGGYYYNNSSTQLNTFGVYAPNVPPGDELVFATYGYQTSNGKPVAEFNTAKTGVRDTSEFISGEFDILKNLTLGEEIRFLSEKELYSGSLGGVAYDSAKFSPVTSRTTLSWKPTKDYNVYFSAANGEKSGGFNPTAATPADLTFAPETDWSYELGVKTTLMDHHLTLNADVFHTDIDGLQQLGAGSAKGAGGFTLLVVKNYGSVTEDGFELEGKYTTDFGLVIGGGLALQDPRYSKGAYDTSDTLSAGGVNYGCAAIPSCASSRLVYLTTANGTQTVVPAGTAGAVQAIDLKGLHLPFAADFTLNLNAEYRHPIQWSYLDGYLPKAEWFARVDYRYEGKEYADIPNFAYVDPKNIINLHAGIENYHWSATLEVLNATNDRTPIGANLGSAANGTDDVNYSATGAAYLPDGRTFSARFAYHF